MMKHIYNKEHTGDRSTLSYAFVSTFKHINHQLYLNYYILFINHFLILFLTTAPIKKFTTEFLLSFLVGDAEFGRIIDWAIFGFFLN